MKIENQVFSSVNDKCFFKAVFPLKLSYWLKALSPRRPEQWMGRVSSSVSITNGHFKTLKLYQLQELDSTLLVNFKTHYYIWCKVLRFFHLTVIFPSGSGQFTYVVVLMFQIMHLLTHHYTHVWHLSLENMVAILQICHIANTHPAIMLNGQIDPTFLHTTTKIQPTATHYCQTCARTNMPLKCHVYVQISDNYLCT